MTVEHIIGQRFIIGLDGPALTPEFRRLVRQYKAGNVILFRENLQSAAQAKALCDDIKAFIIEETGIAPFIAIDQEGGRVSRLPADMTNVASAADLGAAGSAALVEAVALTAAELGRIGVNVNLAPVLDVNSNPANPVIGDRSFGVTPEFVADFGSVAVAAWERAGILCCGKHFPGHGDTSVDSHLALPCVDKTRVELEAVELLPFRRAIACGIPALMSAHILFPQIESAGVPATMSKTIITGILREELGFKGLVLSDAMEMNAIKQYYGTPAGCIEAIRAGVDIVLVCHDVALMEASLVAIAETYTNGGFDRAAFDASLERIVQYKKKYIPELLHNTLALDVLSDKARAECSGDSLSQATTEQCNAASWDIDGKTALEIVTIINSEDHKVAPAIQKILPEIAALVEDIVIAFKNGGRLIYIGAGTSGRLGVLDASECPPTYGVDPSMVHGLIAGGNDALTRSIESAEDRAEAGVADLKSIKFTEADVLVGITASGSAPYVLGALEYAAGIGAITAAISCNAASKTFAIARHRLYADVGPEVITGSTRMKSGTAQKLILNALSTASMIRIGKVYKNLMVDLRPVNQKLVQRSLRLIREVTGCSADTAVRVFAAANQAPKTAIVMVLCGVDCATAEGLLVAAGGHIGRVKQLRGRLG